MILTFESDADGAGLEIHMDEEGRDRLIGLLQNLQKPGDHEHLFRFPEGTGAITMEQFDAGSIPAESVTIWLLDHTEPQEKAE